MKCEFCKYSHIKNVCNENVSYCEFFDEEVPELFHTVDGCNLKYTQAKKLHSLKDNKEEYEKYMRHIWADRFFYSLHEE